MPSTKTVGPMIADSEVAEREGFEPAVEGLPLLVISSHADSRPSVSEVEVGRSVPLDEAAHQPLSHLCVSAEVSG